jgi:PAS domain S-box-containing protein
VFYSILLSGTIYVAFSEREVDSGRFLSMKDPTLYHSPEEAAEPSPLQRLKAAGQRLQVKSQSLTARWEKFSTSGRFQKFAPWGLSLFITLTSALLRSALHPWLGPHSSYSAFLPAIAFTAWYLGTVYGLFTLLIGMLVGNFFFTADPFQFGIHSAEDLIGIILYLVTGFTLLGISESQHHTKQSLESALAKHERNESALRQSEERFRLASEAIHGMLYDWDLAAGHVRRTSKFLQIVGILPDRNEEASHNWWLSQIHKEDVENVHRQIEQILCSSEDHYALEYRVRHWDGHYLYVQDNAHILRDAHGKALRVVGYVVDISDRKETQAEIEDLNLRLKRSIAESHHRIKNNLQVLVALMEMETLENAEMIPAAFQRVTQHIRTLATLHDLLTQEARSGSDLDSVSLPDALERLLELMRPSAGERRLLMRAEEVRLPLKQSGSFTLMVNEIVSNAIKHGKGDIEITLKVEPTEDNAMYATLTVCDDGPGFPPDFDPRRSANTGLELIESMGRWDLQGEICYQNRPEGGASVVVTFAAQR